MVPIQECILIGVFCCVLGTVSTQSLQTLYLVDHGQRTVIPEHGVVNQSILSSSNNDVTITIYTDVPPPQYIQCYYQHGGMVRNVNAGDYVGVNRDRLGDLYLLRLRRVGNGNLNNEGIWHCDAPASGKGFRELNFGFYYSSNGGVVRTCDQVTISSINANTQSFTLTCVTTGGPPTTFSWTRNGVNVPNNNSFVSTRTLSNRTTSTYTNTLRVTGRFTGTYQFTASNSRTTTIESPVYTPFPDPPPMIRAEQTGLDEVTVMWGSTSHRIIITVNSTTHSTDAQSPFIVSNLGVGMQTISLTALSSVTGLTGDPSSPISVTVLGLSPPAGVTLTPQSPTSMLVEWTQPSSGELALSGFTIRYSRLTGGGTSQCPMTSDDQEQTMSMDSSERMATISGLHEFSTYTATVEASTNKFSGITRTSSAAQETTLSAAPSMAPQNLTGTPGNRSVTLTWMEVECLHRNGDITEYTVRYRLTSGGDTQDMDVGNNLQTTIDNLDPFISYSFQVAAKNINGTGPFSDEIQHYHASCSLITEDSYTWPKVGIGEVVYMPCPCNDLLVGGSMASRYCRENSVEGRGVWSDIDYSQCESATNNRTKLACSALLNLRNLGLSEFAENASRIIFQNTLEPQNLSTNDIMIISVVVDMLTREATVNPVVRDNYLRTIDNIQQADKEAKVQSNSSSRMLNSLGKFLDEVDFNSTSNQTVLAFKTYAIQVQDIELDSFNGQTLNIDLGSVEEALMSISNGTISADSLITNESAMDTDVLANATGTVQITASTIIDYCGSNVNNTPIRISFSVFLSDALFRTSTFNQMVEIGSIIVAYRIHCGSNATNLMMGVPTVNVTLRTSNEFEEFEDEQISYCAIWNEELSTWTNSDSEEIRRGDNVRVCEYNRLGHFGILFDLTPRPVSPEAAIALSVITYIGLTLSLVSLVIFVLTYLGVKNLRTSVHGQILINMSIALIGLYVCFLISVHATPIKILCGFSSAFLHYFMLVFFGWTVVEAVWLYLQLVLIFGVKQYQQKFIPFAIPITWVVPFVIVVISVGAGHTYYIRPFICRATEWPFWFGFILPFLVMYLFDWIMFLIIIGSICKNLRNVAQTPGTDKVKRSKKLWKQNFTIAVVLCFTFGLGWGFGLLATSHDVEELSLTFQVLFSIFVGMQGVLMLILHGIRNLEIRKFWGRLVQNIANKLGIGTLYNIGDFSRTAQTSNDPTDLTSTAKPTDIKLESADSLMPLQVSKAATSNESPGPSDTSCGEITCAEEDDINGVSTHP